jgi:signal transduction histidine kinase
MPMQPVQISFSLASQSEVEQTAHHLMLLRDEFLNTGDLQRHMPRPLILDSWRRCQQMQVEAGRRLAHLPLTHEKHVAALLSANEPLLQAARPVLQQLHDFLGEYGYVVAIGDNQARLLEVSGNVTLRRKLARVDFLPGSDWSEAIAGTNAIGTAIAIGHAVQLTAAEHYCEGWQDITCTAAPIRHPVSGAIIGALDITGDYRLRRPFLGNYLVTAALEIQQRLRANLAAQHGLGKRSWSPGLHLPTIDQTAMDIDPTHASRILTAERLAAAAGLVSTSLDLHTTIAQVAEHTAFVLQLDCAAVGLFGPAGTLDMLHGWLRHGALHPFWIEHLKELLRAAPELDLLRERSELVVINDLRRASEPLQGLIAQADIRALTLLPLTTSQGMLGVLVLPRSQPTIWMAHEVRLGLALAAQAAVAIENARLLADLRQRNRHVETLSTLGQFLRSLPDPSRCLDQVLAQIARVMQFDAGLILLHDQSAQNLYLAAHYGLHPAGAGAGQVLQRVRYLIDTSIEGIGVTVCTQNSCNQAARVALQALHCCDAMAVPLTVSGVCLGVLLVGSYDHSGLTDDDLGLFTTIGQQLGLALKNAELLRSAAEMEALRATDQLKREFLATISHDLRSPLTAIRTSVESLSDRWPNQSIADRERLLHHMTGQVGRLSRLVDQLLDLSRIEAGALQLDCDWTDLPVLLSDTLDHFEELNSNVVIVRAIPTSLPLQYIDPDSMVQALWNLLENAAKYAPQSPIRVEARQFGEYVQIAIADRGPGIPESDREQIFERFYRLKRERGNAARGSGLGLAICRGIVAAHGGQIWVEAREGGGCIFRIALPASPAIDPGRLDDELEAS